MKKTAKMIICILIISGLICCKKNNIEDIIKYDCFYAGFSDSEPDSKTTFINSNLEWVAGDVISINGCKYVAEQSGTSSSFVAVDKEAEGETYVALYPSSIYQDDKLILPEVQNYETGSAKNFPMYAESNSKNLSFANICGMLAIQVVGEDNEIVKKN